MKMSVYLFTALCYLLLHFLMCSTLCEQTLLSGQTLSVTQNTFEVFKDDTISNAKKPEGKGEAEKVTVKEYYSPAFVSTKEFVFALTGVERDDQEGKRNIDVLTKYIKYEDLLAKKNDLTADGWTPQFAVQYNVEEANNIYFVKCILAAATEEKVYLLLLNYTKNAEPKWEFKFAIATMNKGQGSGEQIVWTESDLTAADLAEKLKKEFGEVEQPANFVFRGSGFLTYEKKVVFALAIENLGKKMTALIQLEDEKKQLNVLNTEIAKDCHPYFFPWENKIIMVPVNCDENNKQIMELKNIGASWEKSKKALFQKYEFFKEKQNFVTVKNGATEILLFTEHEPTTGEAQKKVNLWMSDGIRLKKIGEISADADTINPTSFLLANDKLFYLNQHLKTPKIKKVELTYLKGESPNILSTMDVWKNADAKFKNLCDKENDALNILCETDGPVGFLSDSGDNNNWNDKYSDIKAAIHTKGSTGKATKKANGFTFDGEGVGAKWIMKSSNDDQPYHFINSGFTLVATVTIGNGTNDNQNSILGVSLTESTKVGLWCTAGGKWGVSDKDGETNVQASTVNCTRNTTYYVALFLSKTEFTAYVNGQKLPKINSEATEITQSKTIEYFYLGSDSGKNTKTKVTISNVLLYNWPIEEEKIIQLKPKQNVVVDAQQTTGSDNTDPQKPLESASQTDNTSPETSTDKKEKETKSSSPPPTTEDSAARVGVVGVLCFMLFGVFTLLGRHVY